MAFLTDDNLFEDVPYTELTETPLGIAILVVAVLIILVALVSAGVSIYLAIKYLKFNKTKNFKGITGEQAARELLDRNGLEHIKVKCVGSLLFGNSYSHYFKKVRLRRLTWKKDSISSLAMAAQKTGLAVLDKENDKDMEDRIKLTPIITFGPLAFIPIIVFGVILDLLLFNLNGIATSISAVAGFAFMVLSLILQIKTLKTEVKAQNKAYTLLSDAKMATDEEIEMMKELFKLYNIEYVNNIIISFLELLYRILITIYRVAYGKGGSLKSSD